MGDQGAGGDALRERREALEMPASVLARRAGVDRDTLKRIETGANNVRPTSRRAVERALADAEEELGMNDPEPPSKVVRFEVRGVYGAEALVVEGPVENLTELEQMVDRIMRRLRSAEQT